MKTLLLLSLLVPCIAYSQQKGIHFDADSGWTQIQEKAKVEGKYIFVDCFATWCGPCKAMDKYVYTDENLGSFMKSNFISIRVQMDTAKQDNEAIQAWYQKAHELMTQYHITGYPTFLFFSPEGKLVHRGLGFQYINDLLSMARNALDSTKQYYTLLDNYRSGKKDYSAMAYLANTARQLQEISTANEVSKDYINNFLLSESDRNLYMPENINFMASFLENSKDKAFHVFYQHADKIDDVMQKQMYAMDITDNIIEHEEIDGKLWSGKDLIVQNPDWSLFDKVISHIYNRRHADHAVLTAQIKWYSQKHSWPEMAKYNIRMYEKYGIDTSGWGKGALNNVIYEVLFKHSQKAAELRKGLKWMTILITSHPDNAIYMDTYANLLYKLGRIDEAKQWESRAYQIAPKNIEIHEAYEKMQKGLPTWPTE